MAIRIVVDVDRNIARRCPPRAGRLATFGPIEALLLEGSAMTAVACGKNPRHSELCSSPAVAESSAGLPVTFTSRQI